MKFFRNKKRLIKAIVLIFFIMNTVAFFHAYKFTHFSTDNSEKTKSPNKLSALEKTKTLLFGVNNPKPKNTKFPTQSFQTISLKSNKKLSAGLSKHKTPKEQLYYFMAMEVKNHL